MTLLGFEGRSLDSKWLLVGDVLNGANATVNVRFGVFLENAEDIWFVTSALEFKVLNGSEWIPVPLCEGEASENIDEVSWRGKWSEKRFLEENGNSEAMEEPINDENLLVIVGDLLLGGVAEEAYWTNVIKAVDDDNDDKVDVDNNDADGGCEDDHDDKEDTVDDDNVDENEDTKGCDEP